MNPPRLLLWIAAFVGSCMTADPTNRYAMDKIDTGIPRDDLEITSIDRLLHGPEFLNQTVRICGELVFANERHLRQSDGAMIRLLGVRSSVLDVDQKHAFYNLIEGEKVMIVGVLSDVPWVDDSEASRIDLSENFQRYIHEISYIRYPMDCGKSYGKTDQ